MPNDEDSGVVKLVTCTRDIHWCSGHRVMGHENKCAHLHGHQYMAQITARAPELDSVGRVVDFSVLKDIVGSWIDKTMDHGYLLHGGDAAGIAAMNAFILVGRIEQKLLLLPYNPTAENIARYIMAEGQKLLDQSRFPVEIVSVVVCETPNCRAEIRRYNGC